MLQDESSPGLHGLRIQHGYDSGDAVSCIGEGSIALSVKQRSPSAWLTATIVNEPAQSDSVTIAIGDGVVAEASRKGAATVHYCLAR